MNPLLLTSCKLVDHHLSVAFRVDSLLRTVRRSVKLVSGNHPFVFTDFNSVNSSTQVTVMLADWPALLPADNCNVRDLIFVTEAINSTVKALVGC